MALASNGLLAVVVGFLGKLPYGGMSLYNLHYIAGLHDLGYQVHYVERLNKPDECYDPASGISSDSPSFAIDYLRQLLPRHGVPIDSFSFIDRDNICHGAPWAVLREALDRADFVLTLADATWFDDLERCPKRGYVDGDPMFTQLALLTRDSTTAQALPHYPTLFTYCTRMGTTDCTVPPAGRVWIPTRPVVATRAWTVAPLDPQSAVTALMHWAAGSDLAWDDRHYGHKDVEFERFIDLPKRTSREFVLALGGRRAPRARIVEHGWQVVDPLQRTSTIERYRQFIASSYADLGIAKHAYVASRSGWFSDRSTCYLAAGRPVLHQDTGFAEWLPVGHGVLPFSEPDDCLEALRCLELDYPRHARAARGIAEDHFEASMIVGRMLDDAGFR